MARQAKQLDILPTVNGFSFLFHQSLITRLMSCDNYNPLLRQLLYPLSWLVSQLLHPIETHISGTPLSIPFANYKYPSPLLKSAVQMERRNGLNGWTNAPSSYGQAQSKTQDPQQVIFDTLIGCEDYSSLPRILWSASRLTLSIASA